jgi:hypothetical protein
MRAARHTTFGIPSSDPDAAGQRGMPPAPFARSSGVLLGVGARLLPASNRPGPRSSTQLGVGLKFGGRASITLLHQPLQGPSFQLEVAVEEGNARPGHCVQL